MPFAPEKEALKRAADEVKTRAQIAGLSLRNLSFFQKQAFLQLSPFQEEEKEIGDQMRYNKSVGPLCQRRLSSNLS